MLREAQIVMEPVNAAAQVVFEFARHMENLPKWASGLSTGIEHKEGKWIAQSPMGEVEVLMAAYNEFGVLDHQVRLPDGTVVHNAFRVSPAGTGSILTFIVLRMPGATTEAFEADVAHVRKDLNSLRELMESPASS
jgi:uncharacterized membrane protein